MKRGIQTQPGSVPRGVWERSKWGQAGSGSKVAVLCGALNKKWVTFEGGSKRGSEEGPRERPGKASINRSKAKSERRTLSERMMTESV